jgi:hypothetical protein
MSNILGKGVNSVLPSFPFFNYITSPFFNYVNILECANKINMDEYNFFLHGGLVSGHTFSGRSYIGSSLWLITLLYPPLITCGSVDIKPFCSVIHRPENVCPLTRPPCKKKLYSSMLILLAHSNIFTVIWNENKSLCLSNRPWQAYLSRNKNTL